MTELYLKQSRGQIRFSGIIPEWFQTKVHSDFEVKGSACILVEEHRMLARHEALELVYGRLSLFVSDLKASINEFVTFNQVLFLFSRQLGLDSLGKYESKWAQILCNALIFIPGGLIH